MLKSKRTIMSLGGEMLLRYYCTEYQNVIAEPNLSSQNLIAANSYTNSTFASKWKEIISGQGKGSQILLYLAGLLAAERWCSFTLCMHRSVKKWVYLLDFTPSSLALLPLQSQECRPWEEAVFVFPNALYRVSAVKHQLKILKCVY